MVKGFSLMAIALPISAKNRSHDLLADLIFDFKACPVKV